MDPDVRSGKPCLVGTRIDVATIVGAVATGESVETVAEHYALSVEHVRRALRSAAMPSAGEGHARRRKFRVSFKISPASHRRRTGSRPLEVRHCLFCCYLEFGTGTGIRTPVPWLRTTCPDP